MKPVNPNSSQVKLDHMFCGGVKKNIPQENQTKRNNLFAFACVSALSQLAREKETLKNADPELRHSQGWLQNLGLSKLDDARLRLKFVT